MSANPREESRRKNSYNGILDAAPGTKKNPVKITVQTKARAKEIQKLLDGHHLSGNLTIDAEKEEDIKDLTSLLTPPQPFLAEKVPGRNEPCHCGSGKKYKFCHAK